MAMPIHLVSFLTVLDFHKRERSSITTRVREARVSARAWSGANRPPNFSMINGAAGQLSSGLIASRFSSIEQYRSALSKRKLPSPHARDHSEFAHGVLAVSVQ